jgi:putative peptide zinc metalloprotease protein
VAFIRLPYHVICTLEVQPRDADQVYVDVPGGAKLVKVLVKEKQRVTKGQTLAVLENHDLDLEVEDLARQVEGYKAKYDGLLRQSFGSRPEGAADGLATIEKALKSLEKQLEQKRIDQQHLTLVARRDGMVLPPPGIPKRRGGDEEGEAATSWWGTPLDPANQGGSTILREGTLFCEVGEPTEMEAILVVDQDERDFVRVGQEADVKLDELPHDTFRSKITEISEGNLRITPQRLSTSAGGEVASKKDPTTGTEKPQSTSYQARVPLDDQDQVMRIGVRGRAKVYAEGQSIGQRLYRLIIRTFRFKL